MPHPETIDAPPAACPMHAMRAHRRPALDPATELVVPRHRRLFVSTLTGDDGRAELHLTFGEQDIVFDEPALFGFGHGLAAHARFRAGDAVRWTDGACGWPRVHEMLQTLVEAGLVVPADRAVPALPQAAGPVPSPLPPASCPRPRTWAECADIMRELTGRALAPGHLELVVPVYRVAHPLLDAEGRQVGEGNVFPAPLRLAVDTEWRVCQQPGSRFQDDRPMNMSAMRAMVRHWKPMMAALARLREAYLERCPDARAQWTVGHVQRFTTLVLALPAYLAVAPGSTLDHGALDPVLSSLFRVSDGVRMVTHRMLFTDDHEPSRAAGAPVGARDVYDYAERNTAFLSDHGVCAGPKAMIEEFLDVLFGSGVRTDPPASVLGEATRAALAQAQAAFDYGLLGLQAYAAAFSLWPRMARAYERLAALHDEDPAAIPAPFGALRAPVQRSLAYLREASRIRDETRRRVLEAAYADMYASCGRALGQALDDDALPALLAGGRDADDDLDARLHAWAEARGGPRRSTAQRRWLDRWCLALAHYLRDEQRVVRAAEAVQARLNAHLARERPPPLAARDLALHYRLVAFHVAPDELAGTQGRLPYLVDDLCQALHLDADVRADGVHLVPGPGD